MRFTHLSITSSDQKPGHWDDVLETGTIVKLKAYTVTGISTSGGIPDDPVVFVQVQPDNNVKHWAKTDTGITGFPLHINSASYTQILENPIDFLKVNKTIKGSDLRFRILKSNGDNYGVFNSVELTFCYE